jgi:uncharacterized protein Smg (DUF494 family)
MEIVKVLEEIVNKLNSEPEEITFRRLNKQLKLERNKVAAVYSWIYDKLIRESYKNEPRFSSFSSSFRILRAEEVEAIGLQNYNYLLHFYNKGILNNNDMELILEQIKLLGGEEISIEQLTLMILSVFLETDNFTLPGSRSILYSSDHIN